MSSPEQVSLSPHSSRSKRLEPREFAAAVCRHAQIRVNQSLYAGLHYKDLASLLHQQYEKAAPRLDISERAAETQEFAVRLDYARNKLPQFRFLKSLRDLEGTSSSDSPSVEEGKEQGTLLFLRGYASSEWLNAVGARYSVDPEFFRRHLHDCLASAKSNHFTLPVLPSEVSKMFTLRITTVGRCTGFNRCGRTLAQENLHALRVNAAAAMQQHLESLSRGFENLGDSVVRDFSVHDEEYFSLEQDISFYVAKSGDGWIAIVWTDVGSDLIESPIGPWQTAPFNPSAGESTYLPVVQHMTKVALRSPEIKIPNASPTRKIPQTAALLNLDYGKRLDAASMACDPFYALHDIFRFALCSERGLIGMVKTKIENELDHASLIQREHQNLTNILYNKQILTRHIHRLWQTRDFIKARGKLGWPRPESTAMQDKVDAARGLLWDDVTSLIDLAQSLIKACDAGMTVMMNNAQINEAHSTLRQAESSAKLTKLAFLYVPLSFTTSLLGMNVAEFGLGASVRIWQWLALSCPLLAVSLVFMLWDWQTTTAFVRSVPVPRLLRRRTNKVNDIEMSAASSG